MDFFEGDQFAGLAVAAFEDLGGKGGVRWGVWNGESGGGKVGCTVA